MTEWLVAPVDEPSGLPLPISIAQTTMRLPEKGPEALINRHHAHFPAKALQGNGAGLEAVRQIRLQRLPLRLHSAYHYNFQGPPLPTTDEECFRRAVFATAGHVPLEAVAFDAYDKHRLVALPEEERLMLWQTGTIYAGTSDTVRAFMMGYVARFRVATNASLVDELLHTTNQDRRRDIGRLLLRECSQAAAEPFSEHYALAKKRRLMPLARSRQVGNFVCNLLTLRARGFVSLSAIQEFGALLGGAATCTTGVAIV